LIRHQRAADAGRGIARSVGWKRHALDGSMVEHSKIVATEFARQAEAFARAPELHTPEVTRRIADALSDLQADRILDLACGPGVLASVLSDKARVVVGVDLTDEVLRVARTRSTGIPNVTFARALAEHVPFVSASFDAVVLRLALHHFEYPLDGLAEVRRLLRPGGRVVILDILTSAHTETARLHNAIEILRDPSHVRFLTLESLRGQVLDAGFALVSESSWRTARDFAGWADIISEPTRMASLEIVLRRLARSGVQAGIALREEDGELRFTYEFALLAAESAGGSAA
jgi:ubiquinone/menaquinone biosynthesis C-methylase UbiE